MIRYALHYLQKYKGMTIIYIVVLIISMLLSIVTPYFNGYFIDFLITTTSKKQIVYFALCLIGIGILGAVFSYISNMTTIKLSKKVSFDMVDALISHMQKTAYNEYSKQYTPVYLIKRIQQDVTVVLNFVFANCVQFITNLITIGIIIVLIAKINKTILILTICILPIYLIIYMMIRKPYFLRSKEIKEKESVFFNQLFRRLDLILEIKAEGNYDKDHRKSQNQFATYLKSYMGFGRLSYIYASLDQIISIIFQAAVLIVGGIQIVDGNMTIGQYTILSVYFTKLIKIIAFYFNMGTAIQESKASYHRIKELYECTLEANGQENIKQITSLKADLVDYSYDKQEIQLVLADFTHDFTKNKIYTIVGKNGTGKTTLLHLLTGVLQELENGMILMNGKPITELDMIKVRQQLISIFLQSAKVDDITVEEYLQDELELDTNQVLVAIKEKGLNDLYCQPNFRIENFFDNKLATLSGGERQKVLLLKALLKPSDLLILDEPTNNLDQYATTCLIEYLQKIKENKIILMTSHDPQIIDMSDEIINLDPVFF